MIILINKGRLLRFQERLVELTKLGNEVRFQESYRICQEVMERKLDSKPNAWKKPHAGKAARNSWKSKQNLTLGD